MASERDVFINCPFDLGYEPVFNAIVFTVIRSGFRPRSSLEDDDGGTNRLAKIQKIIRECPFGIHDISRTESDGSPPLPRFNMPFELGLFLGAQVYGGPILRKKKCLIPDVEQHRYQRFISDISGQDIKAHNGSPEQAISRVADWLRNHSGFRRIPGGAVVASEYQAFETDLPRICQARDLSVSELKFNDRVEIITGYVTAPPNANTP